MEHCSELTTSSDERIKKDFVDLDDNECLNLINQLKPRKYKYKDPIGKANFEYVYGFIAQEVKQVLPYAVNSSNIECIPDVYNLCSVDGSNICLTSNVHSFDVGDKVKFFDDYNKEHFYSVKDVIDTSNFIIDESLNSSNMFCYGKEINNFHTLDKSAIYTVGISAIQELSRQLTSALNRITELENKINNL